MNLGDDSTDIFEVESNEFEQNPVAVNESIVKAWLVLTLSSRNHKMYANRQYIDIQR